MPQQVAGFEFRTEVSDTGCGNRLDFNQDLQHAMAGIFHYLTARSGGGSSLRREVNMTQIPPSRKMPPKTPGAKLNLLSTEGVTSRAGDTVSFRGDKLISACTRIRINPNTNNAMP
jgi:hypothetical protein